MEFFLLINSKLLLLLLTVLQEKWTKSQTNHRKVQKMILSGRFGVPYGKQEIGAVYGRVGM